MFKMWLRRVISATHNSQLKTITEEAKKKKKVGTRRDLELVWFLTSSITSPLMCEEMRRLNHRVNARSNLTKGPQAVFGRRNQIFVHIFCPHETQLQLNRW